MISRVTSSPVDDSQGQTGFASAYRSYHQPPNTYSDKGKGREQEAETPWTIDNDVTPISDAWGGLSTDSFAGGAHITDPDRYRADRYGYEARRLQIQEAQDEKSRELALRLDEEERVWATRRHAFEPPPLFPRGNKATPSLPSVGATASALAGFVGGKLSSFARSGPSADKDPSMSPYRPSTSKTKPVAHSSSGFMVALKQQMKEQEETRSAELARRLQREEEAAILRESSSWSPTKNLSHYILRPFL